MKNVVAFIRPERLPQVKQELFSKDLFGLSVTEARCDDEHRDITALCSTLARKMKLPERVRVELVVQEPRLNDAISAIETGARTDAGDGGFIFFQPRNDSMRTRASGSM
ncbi:MAG: P-II family nitrogen regulator [Desulfovibrionales bacterium]|nr:P-II family nitrogen regulator [Desulfovibrionales bacterium]